MSKLNYDYPTLAEILEDPMSAPIPPDDVNHAMVASTLEDQVTFDNFNTMVTYMLRPEFSKPVAAYWMIHVCKKSYHYCSMEGFVQWAKANKALRL